MGVGDTSATIHWGRVSLQTYVCLFGQWVRCVHVMWSLCKAGACHGAAGGLYSGWGYCCQAGGKITGREFFSSSCCFADDFFFFGMWNRWNETTFSAIFYLIKMSMQYMNWGGKCSPERLMQFSYFTWMTAFLPRCSWETALMSHSTQQFRGFQWGGAGLRTWHCFLAVSTRHFSIWRVPSNQSLNYCHLAGNWLKPIRSHCIPGH